MWGQLLLVVPLCILEGGINLKYKPEQFKLEETTIWSFKERGNWATHRGDYRGNCPPQVPRNLILKYTNEGDIYGYDGLEISKLYTWEELLCALDDEYLLTDDVPDDAPTEVIKEEHDHKILLEYEVEREQEYDDEYGHFEVRYYTYEVQICVKN